MLENQIKEKILQMLTETKTKNPIEVFLKIVKSDFIPMHGPIHHIIDGASFLCAFYNACGNINLNESFAELCNRAEQMPGAMCGYWGVCGAVTSIGAALSIIEKTGPLSTSDWGSHMVYTSKSLEELSKTGGPRCCKRNGILALQTAVNYINENQNQFGVVLEKTFVKCEFSSKNQQCLKKGCPFYESK